MAKQGYEYRDEFFGNRFAGAGARFWANSVVCEKSNHFRDSFCVPRTHPYSGDRRCDASTAELPWLTAQAIQRFLTRFQSIHPESLRGRNQGHSYSPSHVTVSAVKSEKSSCRDNPFEGRLLSRLRFQNVHHRGMRDEILCRETDADGNLQVRFLSELVAERLITVCWILDRGCAVNSNSTVCSRFLSSPEWLCRLMLLGQQWNDSL